MFKKTYEILILDGKTGKLLKRAMWGSIGPSYKDDRHQTYTLSNDESGEIKLGIRFVDARESRITRGMNILTFNENFDVVSNDKIPLVNSDLFVNCTINKKGDFFFLSADESGRFTAQSFAAKTWVPRQKVSFSVDARNKSKFSAYLFPSSISDDQAFVSVNYLNADKEKANLVGKIDFSSGKSFIHEVVPDKHFLRSVKENFVEVNKELDKPDYDNWEHQHLTGLVEVGDKIAVVREVRFSYTSNSDRRYWVTGDALVSVLNNNMSNCGQPGSSQTLPV